MQEGTYERIGDEKTLKTDVRIVAATNRNLKEEVLAKRFREDLYYRLNVFPIEVPPLRHRTEDIPSLANRFLNQAASKLNRPLPQFTKANMLELKAYDWPGNVRELQNVIERAVITSRSGKLAFNLTQEKLNNGRRDKAERRRASDDAQPVLTEEEMKQRDRENLLNALHQSGWKITGDGGAAEILGMKPTTLHSKIKKLGLKNPD